MVGVALVAVLVITVAGLLDPERGAVDLDEPPSFSAFRDRGPRADVEAVKRRAVALLRADLSTQQHGVSLATIRRRIARIYAREAVAEQVRLAERALRAQRAGELPNSSFSVFRITVDAWRGVRVRDGRASALLDGALGMGWKGTWEDRRYRWRIDLVHEEHAWKIRRLSYHDYQWSGSP
jgi:hypothetical protein